MTDCVKLIEVGHNHDHEENEDNHTAEYDEHVWTSPLNAIKISEAISKEMQKYIVKLSDMVLTVMHIISQLLLKTEAVLLSV